LPALVGIGLVAQGAEAKELFTTAAVTALGGVILIVRQRMRRASASV
jgi:hypothetical protein